MNQEEAKNEILNIIRSGKPSLHPLPDVPMYPFHEDPVQSYIERLLAFDGRAVKFKSREDALRWLKEQPELEAQQNVIYSSVPDVQGNFTEADLDQLGKAAKIQTCVTEGEMGVGETGSMWVSNKSLKHAVCGLLARRLFVFIDKGHIVGGLHEAYAALKNLRNTQYGSFFSGPSATADIEAVHITGAQGPLAFTALIYNCDDAPDKPELLVNPEADESPWQKDM